MTEHETAEPRVWRVACPGCAGETFADMLTRAEAERWCEQHDDKGGPGHHEAAIVREDSPQSPDTAPKARPEHAVSPGSPIWTSALAGAATVRDEPPITPDELEEIAAVLPGADVRAQRLVLALRDAWDRLDEATALPKPETPEQVMWGDCVCYPCFARYDHGACDGRWCTCSHKVGERKTATSEELADADSTPTPQPRLFDPECAERIEIVRRELSASPDAQRALDELVHELDAARAALVAATQTDAQTITGADLREAYACGRADGQTAENIHREGLAKGIRTALAALASDPQDPWDAATAHYLGAIAETLRQALKRHGGAR